MEATGEARGQGRLPPSMPGRTQQIRAARRVLDSVPRLVPISGGLTEPEMTSRDLTAPQMTLDDLTLHTFKTGVGAEAPRRVRFPSASATAVPEGAREEVGWCRIAAIRKRDISSGGT